MLELLVTFILCVAVAYLIVDVMGWTDVFYTDEEGDK